jgi:hypothetical protein
MPNDTVIGALRDALAQRGITEAPPWREDVSGHAFADRT